jgi:sigma-B regulation protein RsbU (phosphoserine phosphatase)
MSNAEGQHFITFFVALYDKEKKRLKYVNSGHNPPILVKNNSDLEMLTEGSTVLGAFSELPFLNVGIIEQLDSFLFCGFTDGLTEITNSKGEEFGDTEIIKVVKKNLDLEPAKLNASIIKEMEEFKGKNGFMDDITLFTCKIDTTKKG